MSDDKKKHRDALCGDPECICAQARKAHTCSCEHPIADVLWEGWDGTCRRCGKDCGDRVLTGPSACSAELADDDDDGSDMRASFMGVVGGQGRTPRELVKDAHGAAAVLGVVFAAVILWALVWWALRAGGVL